MTTDADREMATTRVFDAPRVLVWKVWTQPEHIAQWWGPRGFTNTIHEMAVRAGGVWRLTMHGPDGVDYPNRITYLEVVEPERLVYVHGDDGESGAPPFHVTVTFTERDGKTELTMRVLFATAEARKKVEGYAVEGMNQTLDRLAEHLAGIA
jgi:uncharacterized protein YndB with AHSA1/START domain